MASLQFLPGISQMQDQVLKKNNAIEYPEKKVHDETLERGQLLRGHSHISLTDFQQRKKWKVPKLKPLKTTTHKLL